MTLSPTALRQYKRLRKEHGYPAAVAHAVVKQAEAVKALDLEQVRSASDASIYSLTKDGATYVLAIGSDDIGYPTENGDCYGPTDLAAYDAGDWAYYSVLVTAPNGGTASLGGIDAGPYFEPITLLDTAEQIVALIVGDYDLLAEAVEDGKAA